MSNIVPFLPGVTPSIIPEDEVTISRLSGVLESAFMEHEIDDDGQIYVSDGTEFPLWIDVLKDPELLNFFTYWSVEKQRDADWVARANELNSHIMLPQFSYCRNSILGAYWMTYSGGLNVRQFVKMLRCFSSAFVAGLSSYREDNREAPTPQLALVASSQLEPPR